MKHSYVTTLVFYVQICKKEYNNLSNHLKHAHKLTKREVEELKSEKNRRKAKGDQEKGDQEKVKLCYNCFSYVVEY